MPVMVRSGDAFARVQPHAGRCPEALGRRHRHHQIAPREADRVLHAALLMAGIRVAEPGFEPVMRAEQGEQAGPGGRAIGVAVAHAGGVVEHHDPGRHARPLEHLQQSLAHAFRGLARQCRHPAHVRVRERHRQEMHDPLHARDHGRAWPKSTCALPGAHFNSAKPSDCARCSCLQRLTQRRTDEYPHSATSRSYTRVAIWRCLTGMRTSASGQPSTMAAYPSSTIDYRPAGR